MRWRRRRLIAAAYIVFLSVLLEGTVRGLFAIPAISSRLRANDDVSWRRLWVARHREGAPTPYGFDVHHPIRGWALKPDLRDLPVDGGWSLSSNSRGVRGTTEHAPQPRPDRVRVLVLGDSFTFGEEVDDDETFCHVLQQLMPMTEVINLGVHGYAHDQMLLYLENEGLGYHPDIVVLGFVSQDIARNTLGFRDFAKPRFLLRAGELRLTGVPVPRPETVLRWDWLRPRTLDLVSMIRHRIRTRSRAFARYRRDLTASILTRIASSSTRAGATPVFAYLPILEEISTEPSITPGERRFLGLCRTIESVDCFSARPAFVRAINSGREIRTRGHWDAEGHRAVAEGLRQHLEARGLVPKQ